MNTCLDYMTPADRLGTSLAVKRAASIALLRYRNKYLGDEGCPFVPTPAKLTDVRKTIEEAMGETINRDDRVLLGVPSLLRKQAA